MEIWRRRRAAGGLKLPASSGARCVSEKPGFVWEECARQRRHTRSRGQVGYHHRPATGCCQP
eukprot:355040-Chlamydomonas_euryale.AAC.7